MFNAAKIKALAEAAAAKKQTEYERLMAEKEKERRQSEAEEEQQRAQYHRDMAILAANKVEAVAKARLEAIQELIRQEEEARFDLPEVSEPTDTRQRIQTLVHTEDQQRDSITPYSHVFPQEDNETHQKTGGTHVGITGEALSPSTKVVGLSRDKESPRVEEHISFVPDGRPTANQPIYQLLTRSTPKGAVMRCSQQPTNS